MALPVDEISEKQRQISELTQLGNRYHDQGEFDRALECHRKVLGLARSIGNPESELMALGNIANAYRVLGNLEEAEKGYRHVLELSRELGNTGAEFMTLRHLIQVCWKQKDHHSVVACYQELISRADEINSAGENENLWVGMNAVYQGFSGSVILTGNPIDNWRRFLINRIQNHEETLISSGANQEAIPYTELLDLLRPNMELLDTELLDLLRPNMELTLLTGTLALQKAGRFEEALEYCERVLALNPQNLAAWGIKGTILTTSQRYTEAITCWEEMLRIDLQDAEIWVRMGVCWMHLNEYDEMLKCDEKAIELKPDYAQAWIGKSIALEEFGRFDEANICLEKARELAPELLENRVRPDLMRKLGESRQNSRKKPGRLMSFIAKLVTPLTIRWRFELGRYAAAHGNYKEARKQFDSAAQLCNECSNQKLKLHTTGNLGAGYSDIKEFEKSAQFSEQALSLARQTGDLYYQELAVGNAGNAYLGLGRFQEAEQAFHEALSIATDTENEEFRQKWMLGLIQVYYLLDRKGESAKLWNKVLGYIDEHADWDTVCLLTTHAMILKNEGQIDEVIETVRTGLRVLSNDKGQVSPDHRLEALRNMGKICFSEAELVQLVPASHWSVEQPQLRDLAFKCYTKALEVAEDLEDFQAQANLVLKISAILEHKSLEYGTIREGKSLISYGKKGLLAARKLGNTKLEYASLLGIGDGYINELRPKEAEKYYQEASLIIPSDPEWQANHFTSFSGICLCLGKFSEAQAYAEKALRFARDAGDKAMESQCLGQLHNIHFNLHELEIAAQYDDLQQEVWRGLGNPGPRIVGGVMNFGEHIERRILPRARALTKTGNYRKAYSLFKEAVDFLETTRQNLPLMAHRNDFIWDKRTVYWEAVVAALSAARNQEALEMLELAKARSMLDVISDRDSVVNSIPRELLLEYVSTQSEIQQLQQRYWESSAHQLTNGGKQAPKISEEFQEGKLEKSRGKLFAILEHIRVYEPTFAPLNVGTPVTFPDIVQVAQNMNVAIVEFIALDDEISVIVTSKDSVIKTTSVSVQWDKLAWFNQTDLDNQIEKIDTVTNLLNLLMQPVAKLLDDLGATRVVLVPSRFLHLLPLHAAWYMESGQRCYLFDRYEISYAPSVSILAQCALRYHSRQYNDGLLTVTDPSGDAPFADEESSLIGEILDGNSLTWDECSDVKKVLADEMPTAGYLHVCSHGSEKGLYLLGNKQDSDSRLLMSTEIQRLDLSKVRLVTLSACESGKTEPGGHLADEYIGLPTSFLIASTPTVVASFWRVSGFSTMLLMWKFYSFLSEEMSVSQALQKAQIWLRSISKSELLDILETFRLKYHSQSLNSKGNGANFARNQKAFWRIESAKKWLESQPKHPFSRPYWWAGFQVIGWPGKIL